MKVTYEATVYKPDYQILAEGLTEADAHEMLRKHFAGQNVIQLNGNQWGEPDLPFAGQISGIVVPDKATNRRRAELNEVEADAKNKLLDYSLRYEQGEYDNNRFLALVLIQAQLVIIARRKSDA